MRYLLRCRASGNAIYAPQRVGREMRYLLRCVTSGNAISAAQRVGRKMRYMLQCVASVMQCPRLGASAGKCDTCCDAWHQVMQYLRLSASVRKYDTCCNAWHQVMHIRCSSRHSLNAMCTAQRISRKMQYQPLFTADMKRQPQAVHQQADAFMGQTSLRAARGCAAQMSHTSAHISPRRGSSSAQAAGLRRSARAHMRRTGLRARAIQSSAARPSEVCAGALRRRPAALHA